MFIFMRNSGFSFSTFLEIGQPNKVPKSGIRSRSAAATDSSLDELRTADIVPVFKREVQNDKTNYRMISLLPVISIFEKVLVLTILQIRFYHQNSVDLEKAIQYNMLF